MPDKTDGGPAFPIPCDDDRDCGPRFANGYGGMSLRDYFAHHAPAMPSWYAENWRKREHAKAEDDSRYYMREIVFAYCEWRLEYSDAMLKAREVKP